MKIGVFTAICEEDSIWIDQYLREIERLGLDFAIHLDKTSPETAEKFLKHPLCVGHTRREEGVFSEKDKQGVLDILSEKGYEWAVAWDVDETWEREFPEKLKNLETETADLIKTGWVNLWEDKHHIRRDGPYASGHREKIRRLTGFRWLFKNDTVNGPSAIGRQPVVTKWDADCIHWGMMTEAIRQLHKDRWDRIYGNYTDDNKNPYGFWEYSVDNSIQPIIETYDKTN